jgi:hypothetical protein
MIAQAEHRIAFWIFLFLLLTGLFYLALMAPAVHPDLQESSTVVRRAAETNDHP